MPYYYRFSETFPDLITLANAPEDELLKLWEGLGYYSRARNLHFAAKSILKNYKGKFPADYESIRKLKGVGDYTAAAIASIAFGLPYAVVDGNVNRVLSRYFGIFTSVHTTEGKKTFMNLSRQMLLESDPGMHNQAMMEFGALVCTPINPDCNNCPLNQSCSAFLNGNTKDLPLKQKSIKKSTRYFLFIVIESTSHILIEKRIHSDIWRNLFQLPLIESDHLYEDTEILMMPEIKSILNIKGTQLSAISPAYTHKLTHRTILARFIRIYCNDLSSIDEKLIRVNKEEIYKFAFPVLIKKYMVENEII
jgi:A/G-specific adenine glycosylase